MGKNLMFNGYQLIDALVFPSFDEFFIFYYHVVFQIGLFYEVRFAVICSTGSLHS